MAAAPQRKRKHQGRQNRRKVSTTTHEVLDIPDTLGAIPKAHPPKHKHHSRQNRKSPLSEASQHGSSDGQNSQRISEAGRLESTEAARPSSTVSAGPTKMHEVLGTTELLEAILLHVPIIDLLTNAQRVGKTWKDTIDDSPRLQEAIFLRPVSCPGKIKVPITLGDGEAPSSCASIFHTFGPDIIASMKEAIRDHVVVLNPMLSPLASYHKHTAERKLAIGRHNASWRRMIPSQPPIEFSISGVAATKLDEFGDGVREPFSANVWCRYIRVICGPNLREVQTGSEFDDCLPERSRESCTG